MDAPMDMTIDGQAVVECCDLNSEECLSHEDKDHKHIFDVYEKYLSSGRLSESESDDSDVSVDENFLESIARKSQPRVSKVSRRFSCYQQVVDDYNQEMTDREVDDKKFDQSLDDFNEELPWNLDQLDEQAIIDIINNLNSEVDSMILNYPKLLAENMKRKFENFAVSLRGGRLKLREQMNQKLAANESLQLTRKVKREEKLTQLISSIENNFERIDKLMKDWKVAQVLLDEKDLVLS